MGRYTAEEALWYKFVASGSGIVVLIVILIVIPRVLSWHLGSADRGSRATLMFKSGPSAPSERRHASSAKSKI